MMKRIKEIRIKKNIGICLYITTLAFLLMMICSRSSFLYPTNNWDDVNSYFTMGKGMMNGLVIYRDLYEQKGPYLYFLYGLAYLISHRSFLGVFIFEVIAAAAFLGISCNIMSRFCSRRAALILLPFLGASVYVSKSFYWGGAAEEFCLPFLAYSLYCIISIFVPRGKEITKPSLYSLIFNGMAAGIVLQVKYTMAGFYGIWFLLIMLVVWQSGGFKKVLQASALFCAAFLVTMLPWLIYFGMNGALQDWYQVYIYNNLFIYANYSKDTESGSQFYILLKVLLNLFQDNLSYFIFIAIGIIAMLADKCCGWLLKIGIILMGSCLFLNIFIGGSTLPYYSIPLTVFTGLGYGYAGRVIDRILHRSLRRMLAVGIVTTTTVCSILLVLFYSMNVPFMQQDRDSFFVNRFADIIMREDHPTLANIGCLDVGLYTVTGIIPTCKFFQTNAIRLQEMDEEQAACIANGTTQFIVLRDQFPQNIYDHYELVAQAPYQWGNYQFVYYLFKRIG